MNRMSSQKKRWRPILLPVVGICIVAEIVVLSPSPLEESKSVSNSVDPETLILDNEPSLVPGLPQGKIADYAVDGFNYVSVQDGAKQWKIEADRAFLYNDPEKLVHSRIVTAYLYDPDGKATIVKGLESKYYVKKKELEMFGNVKTVFPDGFELYSDYLLYKPDDRHIVIPIKYPTRGIGHETADQSFQFTSYGLDYFMGRSLITLPKEVVFILEKEPYKKPNQEDPTQGVPEKTVIESDYCIINREKKLALFTMRPKDSTDDRFVHINQPTLFVKSRRADLNYGDFTQILQYLVAYDDVFIKEKPAPELEILPIISQKMVQTPSPETKDAPKQIEPETPRYATGGRADFDTHRNIILLSQFPQVYQGGDTVTGDDIVILHRDTGVVEVDHSNAFSAGN
jgi:hypothetical protein